jgi:hypothetical protein
MITATKVASTLSRASLIGQIETSHNAKLVFSKIGEDL